MRSVYMTTGELIAELLRADPEGNTPVCVANSDVYFPAYYDGRLQQLIHDDSKRGKEWGIIGAKVISKGHKVDIVAISIGDILVDMPDLPVEGANPEDLERRRSMAMEEE